VCTLAESTSTSEEEERDSVGSISGGGGARFSSAVCFGPLAAAAAYDILASYVCLMRVERMWVEKKERDLR